MSETNHATPETKAHSGLSLVHILESGDGMAHVLVAILLLILALGVLVNSTVVFIRELPQHMGTGSFVEQALGYLSDVLFGVIILELLSTILTYIQARNLEATVKDFLVVGLISSVRKILLIGAQSSLEKSTGSEFIKESIGTVISIAGILLLIGGLLLLDYRKKKAIALVTPTDSTDKTTIDEEAHPAG